MECRFIHDFGAQDPHRLIWYGRSKGLATPYECGLPRRMCSCRTRASTARVGLVVPLWVASLEPNGILRTQPLPFLTSLGQTQFQADCGLPCPRRYSTAVKVLYCCHGWHRLLLLQRQKSVPTWSKFTNTALPLLRI